MEILLNGKTHQVPEGCLVSELIMLLELQGKRLAVEINQEIVPRSEHPHWRLQPGDKVEIVHAIGGGQTLDSGDNRL
ncbi:sulfur carrier protein ThiS [Nitrosococcus wardiae]|uniref:Sulfur carrier protein ThiS n=1 Tax=Nitrosococcus wardiae TaxID=1814290 RepID=A0A4P7C3R2_9GAMM|nr:sulfur carrier protein ThiS [Nitrosococcus wardiae]QBQ55442.1 sulfur carrier protein ThiS [Nitrosococcus wardiae]